jgi:hypothetical protein
VAQHPIELTQAEFCRLARGDRVVPGKGPAEVGLFLLGMRSAAGAACRDVHRSTPAQARSRLNRACAQSLFNGGNAASFARNLLQCLDRYIELDGIAGPAALLPGKSKPIPFGAGDIVKARPDVVLGPSTNGAYEVRVLLFDDLPLTNDSAELIALPAVEFVRAELGATADRVLVWQLSLQQEEAVSAAQAQGRKADVTALLAGV